MRFSLGTTVSKVAAVIGVATRASTYIRDNLKIYFDFKSTTAKTLEFVGTGSCQFEGADDEIQIADHANLDGMDQLTVMCWFNYDSTCDNAGNLISKEHDDAYQLQVDTSNNRVQWFVNGASDSSTTSGISINTWHHVACTYDSSGNGTGQMYIDGVLDQTDTTFSGSTIGANAHPLYLGGDSNSTVNFGGLMKNVGIWNRVLSASEIQNIMYKTYSDLKGTETTALLAWYPLEANGDDSTDNYDGTASGDITFHRTNYGGKAPIKPRGFDNAPTAQADLIGSGSASFDGDDDYIDCGTIDFDDDDISMVAWYKADAFDDPNAAIINNRSSSGTNIGIQIRVDSGSDDIELFTDCGSTTFSTKTGSFVPSVNRWTHVAATVDRSALQSLYIDGILQATTDVSGQSSADLTNDESFKIGVDQASNFFNGNIAQVGIWVGTVLTQEQIQSIKEKTYSDLTTDEKEDLVSWWGLDAEYLPTELLDDPNCADATKWDTGLAAFCQITGGQMQIADDGSETVVDITEVSAFSVEAGQIYRFTCTISDFTGGDLHIKIGNSHDATNAGTASYDGTWLGGNGTVIFDIKAGNTTEMLIRTHGSNGFTGNLSNLSVKKLQVEDLQGSNHGSLKS